MAKRLKRVYGSSDQVLHLWANQSQSDARCANVFFEGPRVWSYGYHYELGRLHVIKGQTIALINSHRYSVTTGKHIGQATGAVSHLLSLGSSDVGCIETALEENQVKLVDALFDHFKGRKYWFGAKIDQNHYTIQQVNQFNKVCDLVGRKDLKLEIYSDFIGLMNDHIQLSLQRAIDKEAFNKTPEEIARKARLADAAHKRLMAKLANEIALWKSGGALTEGIRALEPQIIRVVVIDGGVAVDSRVVQTSKGAEVPLNEALTMLKRIVKGSAKQGDKIGSFKLTGVIGQTVKIGCHNIDLEEAKNILKAA